MIRADAWKHSLLVTALVLAAVALVAGCGGQGNQGGAPADSAQTQGGEAAGGTDVATTPEAGGGAAGGGAAGGGEKAGGGDATRAPASRTGTLAAGTEVVAALQQTVASDKSSVGDRVSLRTVDPMPLGGGVTIPAGSTINGEVTHVKGAGRLGGGAELTLRFHELVLTDGTTVPITCDPFRLEGKGDSKETALEIGGGAVAGGIVGGVLGGKKDIAKGAAAGAVVGTGVAIATKGNQIVLPVGQKLNVKVTEATTVTVKRSAS